MRVNTREPGTVGNLTIEEESKLQEAWVHLLRLSGVYGANKLKPAKNPKVALPLNGMKPEVFRQRLWSMILADHPDATILRFLRAYKWDVGKAMVMLTSNIAWRNEIKIDETIVQKGETLGLKPSANRHEKGFIQQYRSGKAYARGQDKAGRPVFIIKVRMHDPRLQTPEAMELFILHSIESLRSVLGTKYGVDRVCLIFDLTGISLRNIDLHVVRFLISVFEVKYPETLGVVLIHNAPFIFWSIWKIIRPWLDPVTAAKINFTKNNQELAEFIDTDQLQKEYSGDDPWEYKYIELEPGEEGRMESEKKLKILAERNDLIDYFEQITMEWVQQEPDSPGAYEKDEEKRSLIYDLRMNYWTLDPYIRARTYYHRANVIQANGTYDLKGAR